MEDWKTRLRELVMGEGSRDGRIPPVTMGELFIQMQKPNIKPLEDFIEQEIEKAREEVRQEERDMFIVRYATASFNEVIKTIRTLSFIEFLSIKLRLKWKGIAKPPSKKMGNTKPYKD